MTDALLEHTDDGGEITYAEGRLALTDGPETAMYLSLFGGNFEDTGDTATESVQWWGNRGETELSRQYRSRTQSLIEALPAVPQNLSRIEDAMRADLQWMLDDGIAVAVNVTSSIPAPKRIRVRAEVFLEGDDSPFVLEDELDWLGQSE